MWLLLVPSTGVATLASRGGASVTYSRGGACSLCFKSVAPLASRGVSSLASSRDVASSIGVASSAPSEGVSFLDFFFRRGFDFS